MNQLYHLGSAYALYFRFVKYCIGLLVVMLIVSGIYGLASNIYADDCPEALNINAAQFCYKSASARVGLANKKDTPDLLKVHLMVCLASVFATVLYFHYIRYRVRRTDVEADD